MFCQDNYTSILRYAARAHAKQVTFEDLPYMTHVVGVTNEVIHACIESNIDDDKTNLAISVSLLHDILEKTRTRPETILKKYGQEIADGVNSMTKNYDLEKQEQFEDNMQRLLAQPKEIQMIKLADRINNLCIEPEFWDDDEIEGYIKESKAIYSYLKDSNIYLANRLNSKIVEFEDYLDGNK